MDKSRDVSELLYNYNTSNFSQYKLCLQGVLHTVYCLVFKMYCIVICEIKNIILYYVIIHCSDRRHRTELVSYQTVFCFPPVTVIIENFQTNVVPTTTERQKVRNHDDPSPTAVCRHIGAPHRKRNICHRFRISSRVLRCFHSMSVVYSSITIAFHPFWLPDDIVK